MKDNILSALNIIYWKLVWALKVCFEKFRISSKKMEPMEEDQWEDATPEYVFRPYQIDKIMSCHENRIFSSYPKARSGHRIVCTESHIFCFGGFNPDLTVRLRRRRTTFLFQELWRLNLISKEWKMCCGPRTVGMPEELASNAMVAINDNKLIIFGGTGYPFGEACSNKCFILNTEPFNESITQLEVHGDLPLPLYGSAIVVHENYLYTIGGTTGFDYSCDIYRLNLLTRQWECVYICKPEMEDDPTGRYRHEIIYDGKYVYLLGGGTSITVSDLDEIPAFDLDKHKWLYLKTKPDPSFKKRGYPHARRCHSCAQYNTDDGIEAVIAGGCGNTKYFDDIWKLRLKDLQWTLLRTARLPYPTYFHDAATPGNGCLYIYGGIEVRPELTRTSNLYKIWVTVPKLSEICWDAVTFYNPKLGKYPRNQLISKLGIPQKFLNRIHRH